MKSLPLISYDFAENFVTHTPLTTQARKKIQNYRVKIKFYIINVSNIEYVLRKTYGR